jgi:hypothetical protein
MYKTPSLSREIPAAIEMLKIEGALLFPVMEENLMFLMTLFR